MEIKTEILETIDKMPLSLQQELLHYAQYLQQKYSLAKSKKQNSDDATADFRTSWHEAMTGKTIPVSQLWEELEDE